jgi:M6 family metalloprotease-like protein
MRMKKRMLWMTLVGWMLLAAGCSSSSSTFSSAVTLATTGTSTSLTSTTVTSTSAVTVSGTDLTLKNVGANAGLDYLNSTGTDKILVVPIELSDYPFTTSELSTLKNTFFGSASDTGWQSVSSYYSTSSYGALTLTGTVSDKVSLGMTSTAVENAYNQAAKQNETYTDVIASYALKTLASKGMDLSDYDTDNNGNIDALWLVYSSPYNSKSNLYWAFTTWAYETGTYDNESVNTYSWASIDFLNEGNYQASSDKTKNGDAHTYIHETGHMLGLDDYYSYDCDYKTNFDTPMGGMAMMDYNIGDQDAFSKYLLGWQSPTIITDDYLAANNNTVNLTSLAKEGSSVLIPTFSGYNGTALDEYLLLEYYTPTDLNLQDSEVAYTGSYTDFTKAGLLVYHVDASVGKMTYSSRKNAYVWDDSYYDSLPTTDQNSFYYFVYSNSRSYSYDTSMTDATDYYRGRLVSLLSATGTKVTGKSKPGYATDTLLFETGDSVFGSGTFADFAFDDNTKPAYAFTIASSDSTSCQLTFTKA